MDFDEREAMSKKPLELRLCETKFLVLKPNQLYIFTVDVTCKNCLKTALEALGGEK